ncbi:TetR/AcrR family transcriptional regulator [Oceanobacter mangrovi]|uniref:TetR/AcrR family transcriptional regulator n=1 Tax=Oceanobacter mangrovi TaxID=2862510 RepID=UPI001C8D874C|nr:TetR/AcrR family transcriptional regulator [Oceanobacter mangrovi]
MTPIENDSYHHGNLRQALLDAAVRTLKNHSVEQLSLRALAREAGVSQTAPYRHFKDKHQLLAELATQGFDELTEALLADRQPEDNTAQAMSACGRGYLRFALNNPEKYRLMFGKGMHDRTLYPELEASGMRAFGVLQEWVTRGIENDELDASDPELTAYHVWACVHGLASLIMDGKSHCSDQESVEQLVEANLGMIKQRLLK